MTQDYKQKLFDYMTGDFEKENPKENIPTINNKYEIPDETYNFVSSYMADNYGGTWRSALIKTFQSVNQDSEGNQYIGMLFEAWNDDITKSVILICNSNLTPLKAFSKYQTGTEFREFQDINVAENGTLYAIDYLESTNVYRFLMINNIFLAKDNNFKISTNYVRTIPSQYYNLGCGYIKKINNESKYIFTFARGSYGNTKAFVSYLEVNVGSDNVWKKFETSSSYDINVGDISIFKSGDNYNLKMSSVDDDGNINIYSCSTSQNNNILYHDEKIISSPNSNRIIFDAWNVIFDKQDNIYGFGKVNSEKLAYLIKISGSHNDFDVEIIEGISPEIESEVNILIVSNILYEINNEIFFYFQTRALDTTIEGTNKSVLGCLSVGGTLKYIETYDTFTSKTFLIVFNQYNLYKVYISANNFIIYDIIYNKNNYNGLSYQGFNSFKSQSAFLKDNVGIQFARNILNRTYDNNIYNSTMQIPNLFLNNMNIVQSNLLGQTNNLMIENNSSFEKNIYENVYVNFLQTFRAINKNESINIIQPIQNGYISNDIVTALENAEDNYNGIKLTKYRLNYTDNTTFVGYLEKVNSEDLLIKYAFSVFIEKQLNSIDLISENENTIYLTIENDNKWETNKIYTITQEMILE